LLIEKMLHKKPWLQDCP